MEISHTLAKTTPALSISIVLRLSLVPTEEENCDVWQNVPTDRGWPHEQIHLRQCDVADMFWPFLVISGQCEL